MFSKLNNCLTGISVSFFGLMLFYYIIPLTVVSPSNVRLAALDPAFWPNIISWLITFIGVLMMITSFLEKKNEVSDTAECQFSYKKELYLLSVVLFFIGYSILLPELGMVWGSSLAYIILSLFVFKTKHRMSAVVVGILLPVLLYAFFNHVAGVSIPQSEMLRLP